MIKKLKIMPMTKRWMAVGGIVWLLAACAPTTASPALPSTPVEDLPVSRAQSADIALPTPVSEAIITAADAEHLLLSNLYERIAPSVVNIEAVIGSFQSGFFDFSRGSGFIYSAEGHIVTNAHVVKDATSIRVTFDDGYVADARLLGADSYSDLAVLHITAPPERLRPLVMGDSDSVRVGQRAIAIGNPFGLNSSMSLGIVSGLGRTLRSAELIDAEVVPGFQNPSIIQVDTPINPGNSGGPLLNSAGEVVGVNTAIRTESGVFEGVGFAVPSNTVRRVVPELIAEGRVDYAWIGISVMPEEDGFGVTGLAEPLNLPVQQGVLIRGVHVGSPADKAGLRGGTVVQTVRDRPVCVGGDIIVAIDGVYVSNMDELVAYLVVNSQPGDTVTLRIVRGDETLDVPLVLEARPTTSSEVNECNS